MISPSSGNEGNKEESSEPSYDEGEQDQLEAEQEHESDETDNDGILDKEANPITGFSKDFDS